MGCDEHLWPQAGFSSKLVAGPQGLGVGSRPRGRGEVTRQDPQYSFSSCQESGMYSPVRVSSAVGEIFS